MAGNPLEEAWDVVEEAAQTAQQVGSELLSGDVEGAGEALAQGAADTATAAGEVVTATGEAVAQAGQAIDLPEIDTGGELGIDVLGQHVGVGGSVQLSDQGLSVTTHVQDPLGSRDTTVEVDQSGASASTHQTGVLGSEDVSVGIDSGGVSASVEESVDVFGAHVGSAGGTAQVGDQGASISTHADTPFGSREGTAAVDQSGARYEESGEGVLGSFEDSVSVDSGGIAVAAEQSVDILGAHVGSAEGSFHLGVGDSEGVEGPSESAGTGPETAEGAVEAQIGTAVNLAAPASQPLMPTGQYAAASGAGAAKGGAEGGVTADAGISEVAVAVEPGTQAGPVGAGAGGAAEQPMALATEATEPAAGAAPEPSGAVDEVGAPVGVVAEEAIATAPSAGAAEPQAVAAETTEPEAVLWEGAGESVDEVGTPTGVAATQTGTMPLAAEEAEAVGTQAAAAETTEATAVPAEESGEATDELGAPTGVVAPATPTTAHLAGEEAATSAEAPPLAVAGETTEQDAVLWQEPGEAADSGVEEVVAAAEDEGGGLIDSLKDAVAAVGDFIQDVVEKIEDVFDGDD